jgi:hypothetical protein
LPRRNPSTLSVSVARDLLDPRVVRMAGQTGDVHTAGLEVDNEPDDVADETAKREDLD